STSIATDTKEASDTGFVFTNTIRKMVMKLDGMGQQISFDSDKKEDMEGPLGNMKELIGSVQEVGVNQKGIVTSLSSHNDASDKFADAMSLAGQIAEGMPYYMLIPQSTREKKPGDSWIDSSGMHADAMQLVSNYTLKNITPTDVTIAFNTTIMLNRPLQQQGMTMDMNLQGHMIGEAVYDKATGLLKTNNANCDMSGKMEAMGQEIPVTLKGTTSFNVKK
ncbi:MAG TPA: DUF6263 family protein, partial [Chitinophagaceae bacterium]|nr:DUF6263 family protein [Chitinophagaceae bacterium]